MAQYSGQDRFPASFEMVNDGSGRDAASVNVGLEALADRTVYLRNKVVEVQSIPPHTTISPVAIWNSFTPASLGVDIDVPDVEVGDVIDMEFTATGLHHEPAGGDYGMLWFRLTEQFGGAAPAEHNLSSRIAMHPSAGDAWAFGATMRARHTITAAGTVRVEIFGQVNGTLTLWNGYAWFVRRIRP